MTETKNTITFEEKDYDVSINTLCWICLCPLTLGANPYSTTLHLGKDEVTKTDKNLYGRSKSKRPYGELGSVERANCFCCVCVSSSFGDVSPGCGCNKALVDELVAELQARQTGRGDVAQILRSEQTLEKLDEIESKLDKIMDHLKIERD